MLLPVYVRLRVKRGSRETEVIAKANTGFESPKHKGEPLGIVAIREQNFMELGSPEAEIFVSLLPFGAIRPSIYGAFKVKVKVVARDKESGWVEAYAIVTSGKPLIDDYLIARLGIVILDPYEGLWKFRDDPPEKVRRNVL